MANIVTRILKPLTSLKLTIACLSFAMVLVFIGTLAQQNMDAFYAQKKYFNSWFLYWTPEGSSIRIPVFPGGFLLGSVFLVNLIAAHAVRFRFTWKKSGIILTHAGLILLLVGGLFTALWSVESQMIIEQGGTKNYAESFKEFELAVIDKSNPDRDEVFSIPAGLLAKPEAASHERLPFTVKSLQYFPNARLRMRNPGAPAQLATKGMGLRMDVVGVPATTLPSEENFPAAFIELQTPSASLGTWLVWAIPFGQQVPAQTVNLDGKTYELQLRLKRYYKPYQIHLKHLSHEDYAGTNIPKNFASQIRISDPEKREDRDVLIYMNHPLRYRGETYYQYQTLADDKFTVFEAVRNPSWLLPYISCTMVGLGLLIQFGIHLVNFSKRGTA